MPAVDGRTEGHRWFAAVYDILMRPGERGPIGRIRPQLLEGLHGDVLEIGAGTGANFAHYPAESRVIALEPDPYMLKRAEAKIVALGVTNVDAQRAPAEHLPFDDASFDAVVSTLVLCTVRDLPASLAEVRRVLRPGGEFRFLEHVRGEGLLGRLQDLVQPVYGWFFAGCHANRRTEAAFRDAGFEFVSFDHKKVNPVMPVIYGVAQIHA